MVDVHRGRLLQQALSVAHGRGSENIPSEQAPVRNAAASLSAEDQRAAQQEAYDNLGPLYDGTFTEVTAPVIIVTGTRT